MERIHYIIGIIIFIILAGSAAGDQALTRSERVVALTLLGEARGEGNNGMYAVGCVIQKRSMERKITPAQVCLQPKQFSIWNGIKKESDLYYLWKSKSTPYARTLARHIVKGDRLAQSVTGNANHYYSKKIKRIPYWARGKKATKVIGNHVFFKLSSYSIYRNEKGAILVLDINGSANYYMDDLLALSTRWEANSIGLPSQTVSIYENDYERMVFIELPNKNLRAVETYSFDSLGRKCKTPIRGQIIDLQIVNSFK